MLQRLLRCAAFGCATFYFFGPYNRAMSEHRWGAAGPPLEAYSRVTNPERFASLHDRAAGWLHRLERDFETERREAYGLDPEFGARLQSVAPERSPPAVRGGCGAPHHCLLRFSGTARTFWALVRRCFPDVRM
jgi:hypothetical protein